MHFNGMQTTQDFRGQALRCRWFARQVTDPTINQTLLDAANDYEQEAFELERRLGWLSVKAVLS